MAKGTKSNLNEAVYYNLSNKMEPEDIDFAATVFEDMVLFDKKVDLAIGRPKHTFQRHGILFFPLYLVVNDAVVAKIAVFEIKNEDLVSVMDDDEEEIIDINKKTANILPIITKQQLEILLKLPSSNGSGKKIIDSKEKIIDSEEEDEDEDGDEDGDEDEVGVLQVKPSKQISKDIFVDNDATAPPPILEEETEEDSKRFRDEYIEDDSNPWVAKFMKNNNYAIHEVEANGDCFFAVIRDAFKSIGKDTTVAKLRTLLSGLADEDLYRHYRDLFLMFNGNIEQLKSEIKELEKTFTELKKRINNKTISKEEKIQLVELAKTYKAQYEDLQEQIHTTKINMGDVKWMKSIDSLSALQRYMLNSSYWIDSWGINQLERILNIKMIILSEQAFLYGDLDAVPELNRAQVLQCGGVDEEAQKKGNSTPDFYIMTTYSGNHYRLITYSRNKLFVFSELPYSVKVLVINKCMEKNAGAFNLIKDFQDLKVRLGVENDSDSDSGSVDSAADLFDKDVVFTFYENSSKAPKPGKGSGETIAQKFSGDFTKLQAIDNWRRKLDDTWCAPFTLDDHRWNSAEHYLLGSQYKKGFPDFYLQFSLDSESEISKDNKTARIAASETGKTKEGRILRDKKVVKDADYFELGPKQRSVEERRLAIEAKFEQNLDLKHLLQQTKMAKLMHFVRGLPPVADLILMKVRKSVT